MVIIAVGIGAYHNSLQGPFIFDDRSSVSENPSICQLWPIWKALSPSPTSTVGGRPIVNLSLAVNYALGGMEVWGYHALNLAVHVLAGLTLFGVVRRTLARPGLRERFGGKAEWMALAVAVLWTVHPLQTEAVTYISQRCELLMGLFYLLTLYCFIRGAESRRSLGWFALSVAACFLGMASKEVMVTAPVMVLLYDRTFVSGSFREAWGRHWRLYLGLASSWLLLGYMMVGLHNRDVGYGFGIPWWGYALAECRGVVQYLRLALWPRALVFDYGEYVPVRDLAATAADALILVALATSVVLALKRQPTVGFVGAWFFVILAPTSSVVPVGGSPIAEHRMYLPLAAVITLVVIGAVVLGKRLLRKQWGVVLGSAVGGAVVVLFTFLTIQRNEDYSSALSIWRDTVEKRPYNARAHNNLGFFLEQAGRGEAGIAHYELALRFKPEYADANNNLGVALMERGHLQEAIEHYGQALRFKADFAEAHNNLGMALTSLGKLQEAIGQYEEALRVKPEYAEAHYNLGTTLAQVGRLEEAIEHWKRALRVKPDYADAQYNWGLALVHVGRLQEAIEHWKQALRINPSLADAQYNWGLALEKLRRTQEAIGHYEQALRIKPDFAQAREALARARAVQ